MPDKPLTETDLETFEHRLANAEAAVRLLLDLIEDMKNDLAEQIKAERDA